MKEEDDLKAHLDALYNTENKLFHELAGLAGLDPKRDFRKRDLRGLRFDGADIRGFNFSESDLRGTRIREAAAMDGTTVLADANMDEDDIVAISSPNRSLIRRKIRYFAILFSNKIDEFDIISKISSAEYLSVSGIMTIRLKYLGVPVVCIPLPNDSKTLLLNQPLLSLIDEADFTLYVGGGYSLKPALPNANVGDIIFPTKIVKNVKSDYADVMFPAVTNNQKIVDFAIESIFSSTVSGKSSDAFSDIRIHFGNVAISDGMLNANTVATLLRRFRSLVGIVGDYSVLSDRESRFPNISCSIIIIEDVFSPNIWSGSRRVRKKKMDKTKYDSSSVAAIISSLLEGFIRFDRIKEMEDEYGE